MTFDVAFARWVFDGRPGATTVSNDLRRNKTNISRFKDSFVRLLNKLPTTGTSPKQEFYFPDWTLPSQNTTNNNRATIFNQNLSFNMFCINGDTLVVVSPRLSLLTSKSKIILPSGVI